MGLNIVSFFDGMGCLYVALKELEIPIKSYHAYEIDKHAIKAAKALNPNVIHKGDVRFFDVNDYPEGIDLFAGGSPCTDLSFAGKMSGLICNSLPEYMELRAEYLENKDENLFFYNGKFQQSILFWEWLRALKEIQKVNPKVYFLLENVIMPKQHETTISKELGIAPIRINANLVSAQNRDRLFWCNIKLEPFGLFGDLHCTIPQPKDRGILLKHILESDVKEKYCLSDKMLNYFSSRAKNFNNGKVNIRDENGKSSTITASSKSIDISDNFIKVDTDLSISTNQEKANCFTAGGNSGGLHSDMTLIKKFPVCVASRGRNPENPKSRESGLETEQMLEPRNDGKTNCLTSVQKDNLVLQLNPSLESGGKQPYQQNRVYDSNGITPALCANKADLLIFIQKPRGFNDGIYESVDKSPSLTSNSFEHNNFIAFHNSESKSIVDAIGYGIEKVGNALALQFDKYDNVIRVSEATNKGFVEIKPGECFDFENPNSKTRRGRKMEDKSNCLMAQQNQFMQFTEDFRIRRLTPREAGRLQSIPESDLDILLSCGVSDSQLYKIFGNGWNISVITHILSFMKI